MCAAGGVLRLHRNELLLEFGESFEKPLAFIGVA
jgi:hypothetical protein